MQIAEQIKKYRAISGLSQETLAEKIYVTRQSVSNWETGKTYPDLQSLLRMSELFHVSLDTLIKGDVETMKKEIDKADRNELARYSKILTAFFLLLLLTPIPLAKWLGWYALPLYLLIFAGGLYFALKVERIKKDNDIVTYKEIVAFSEGRHLDEVEAEKELTKRKLHPILAAAVAAIAALTVSIIIGLLLK